MPPKEVEETYFRNSLDLKCESACYTDHFKISNKGFNQVQIGQVSDEKEACMTDCFIARKGTTDSQLCMEKCNIKYDTDL